MQQITKLLRGALLTFGAVLLMVTPVAAAGTATFSQGFETDTSGWNSGGSYGTVDRVMSGDNGVTSSEGDYHAVFNGTPYGPYTFFDDSRDEWPGDYSAKLDVYLDPAWDTGEGFDYSVASWGSDDAHQRDFIFHVGVAADGNLYVNASNNTDFAVNDYKLNVEDAGYVVSDAGWYTLQHEFYDNGGQLAVDLNLLDSAENELFSETRTNAADEIPAVVGGNGYGWFTFIESANGINVDATELFVTVPDTTAPLATITNPLDGSEVAGDVTLIGEVEDENPMNSYFRVEDNDGNVVDTSLYTDGRTTHEFDWDTTTVDDGEYTVYFEARDSEGNKDGTRANPGDSVDVIMVTVDNEVDDKQDCKDGNWVLGVADQEFRNQGDCVSHFASDTQAERNPDGQRGNGRQ